MVLPLDLVGLIFLFCLLVQDYSNSNLVICSEDTSHHSCLSSSSNLSYSLSSNQGNQHLLEVIADVDHCSDDSDTEIFRVKRRSTLKVDRKIVIGEIKSDQVKHQVLQSLSFASLCFLFVVVI